MNCQDDYNVDGCSHPDVSVEDIEKFREGLRKIQAEN